MSSQIKQIHFSGEIFTGVIENSLKAFISFKKNLLLSEISSTFNSFPKLCEIQLEHRERNIAVGTPMC